VSGVVGIDAYRPHLRVTGGSADGADVCEYVLPVSLVQDVATGKAPIDAIPEAVWQTIAMEWLDGVRK